MCQIQVSCGTQEDQTEYCANRAYESCASGIACPSALRWGGPFLCEYHSRNCRHCGLTFCEVCAVEHECAYAGKLISGLVEDVEKVKGVA
jgi:hypothetical protein